MLAGFAQGRPIGPALCGGINVPRHLRRFRESESGRQKLQSSNHNGRAAIRATPTLAECRMGQVGPCVRMRLRLFRPTLAARRIEPARRRRALRRYLDRLSAVAIISLTAAVRLRQQQCRVAQLPLRLLHPDGDDRRRVSSKDHRLFDQFSSRRRTLTVPTTPV